MKHLMLWSLVADLFATSSLFLFSSNSSSPEIDTSLGDPRSFVFHYQFIVEDVPAGSEKLEAWIPIPQSDSHQTIGTIEMAESFPYEFVDGKTNAFSSFFIEI